MMDGQVGRIRPCPTSCSDQARERSFISKAPSFRRNTVICTRECEMRKSATETPRSRMGKGTVGRMPSVG